MPYVIAILMLLCALPAAADQCSAFPGAGFFGVSVTIRANQPQGPPIANAFRDAYQEGFSAVGFRLRGPSNADIAVTGTVRVNIGGAAPEVAGRAAASGQAAPEIVRTCRADYQTRAVGRDTALVKAVFGGRADHVVADADVAEKIRCVRLLGSAKGRADANALLTQLRRNFANQKNAIGVVITGLPGFPESRAVFERLKGARCVRQARHEQFTKGTLRVGLKSGLTAERLLPHIRAAVRSVRFTFGGSARITGRWTGQ